MQILCLEINVPLTEVIILGARMGKAPLATLRPQKVQGTSLWRLHGRLKQWGGGAQRGRTQDSSAPRSTSHTPPPLSNHTG